MNTATRQTYTVCIFLPGPLDWASEAADAVRRFTRDMAQAGNSGVNVMPTVEIQPDDDGNIELLLVWKAIPSHNAWKAVGRARDVLALVGLGEHPALRLFVFEAGL